jgi:hypothetical protein
MCPADDSRASEKKFTASHQPLFGLIRRALRATFRG